MYVHLISKALSQRQHGRQTQILTHLKQGHNRDFMLFLDSLGAVVMESERDHAHTKIKKKNLY